MSVDLEYLNQWIGKETVSETVLSVEAANLMNATLSRSAAFSAGDLLPLAWHWLYFHEPVVGGKLGVEGHPELGGFMPPVAFDGVVPRRMWAGGSIEFLRPLRLGDVATKRSRVASIRLKEGRTGRLLFTNIHHTISTNDQPCIQEEQTIVYREPAKADAKPLIPAEAPRDATFSASYTPDPIMLFRYSALTFNGHRIHYDADFCREHEGYPDLVVHGPLIATLLLDLAAKQFPEQSIATFAYRARSPLFNPHPFSVHGKQVESGIELWAANQKGGMAMSATLTLV